MPLFALRLADLAERIMRHAKGPERAIDSDAFAHLAQLVADAIKAFGADHREQRPGLMAEGGQLGNRHAARVAAD